jgi:hypothetical protein
MEKGRSIADAARACGCSRNTKGTIRMRKTLLTAALIGALAAPASADTVTLGGQVWTIGGTILQLGPSPGGGQTTNVPCIICGANQPNQTNFAAGFGYTDFGNTGNVGNVAYFSSGILRDTVLGQDSIAPTNYTGQQIANLLTFLGAGTLGFSIGVDVNDTKVAQTLESFFFLDLTSHTILAAFSPNPLDGVLIPSLENGTGHPDYTLTGLSLAGLDLTHEYAFFARISGANDGPDSFFIVPDVQAVPGPLAGAGLPGLIAACGMMLGLARHRRRKGEVI